MTALKLTWPRPKVALLTLDHPEKRVNVLSRGVLEELAGVLAELQTQADLTGLVIMSGKPGCFLAGADVHEFAPQPQQSADEVAERCRAGQKLFAQLSDLPCPTVAAIDGVCLGGGAELAAWCDRRVFSKSEKTQIGFPEVKLGLLPGWGGTVRAPRIVGLANAVQMICGGEPLTAAAAIQMGWGTDWVAVDDLLNAALRIIDEENQTRQYLTQRASFAEPLAVDPTELSFLRATASAKIQHDTHGQFPAPLAALETMLRAASESVEQALALETQQFTQLFGSPINLALLNVFLLTEYVKHIGSDLQSAGESSASAITSLGVIGAGIMGSGIAAVAVKSDVPTALIDAIPAALEKGARAVIEDVAYDKQTKQPDAARALRYAPLLHTGTHDDDIADADLIIEAVVENAEVKRQILSRVELQIPAETILASNTSSLPITRLAASLKHPQRFCGIHFFNPVRRMKLVEVVVGAQTNDATVGTVVQFLRRIGKMPIIVGDGPGFLVNRMLSAYLNEALDLLLDGATVRTVDNAAVEFGMPVGPMALYDLVGLDTAIQVGRVMWDAFPTRVKVSPILPAIIKAGRLGVKNGKGFYSYENKQRAAQDDPAVEPIVNQYRGNSKNLTSLQVMHRLVLAMLLEGVRVLEEGIARDPRDIDLGVIFGLGFPTFRGGLLYWADTVGLPNILQMLEPWKSLGPRMQPPELLLHKARSGERFYSSSKAAV